MMKEYPLWGPRTVSRSVTLTTSNGSAEEMEGEISIDAISTCTADTAQTYIGHGMDTGRTVSGDQRR